MAITGTVARGSVVWLNFYPQRGNEQAGYHPAIVISDGLIDPAHSDLAFVVPVTSPTKPGYPFHVPVPVGIDINGALAGVSYTTLNGVALTDHAKSLDLSARNAIVIGEIPTSSPFYNQVVTYVRAILA
ncbi:type II toxin-antitoxin system PemK/MazF family toxin [Paenibacillus aurantiacus]|uniref:Type II toxin-antitoxin system PemK/MazF family toxin n=1 Tax=Paenibacillus aurantiacus TaxID=1936118 RepID=A0ABV5KHR5_9BACL